MECTRCDSGWAELRINGQYITSDFCDCPKGEELKKEMAQISDDLEAERWFDAMMERY